jgi:hypothetical protein
MMNYSFNSLHPVNAYGAFGSVARRSDEVVVEGTDEPGLGAGHDLAGVCELQALHQGRKGAGATAHDAKVIVEPVNGQIEEARLAARPSKDSPKDSFVDVKPTRR